MSWRRDGGRRRLLPFLLLPAEKECFVCLLLFFLSLSFRSLLAWWVPTGNEVPAKK